MARGYRRKRGGKFVGSILLPLGKGVTVNLKTTDAIEAARREAAVRAAYARGVRGQRELQKSWGATAAATATVRALDPARPKPAPAKLSIPAPDPEMDADDDDDEDDETPLGQGAGNSDGRTPGDEPALPAGEAGSNPVGGSAPAEPLHVAAAAAAAETAGAPAGDVLDPKQKREAQARDEIAKCLAELGAEGDALGEQLFDLAAAAILWVEGWAISKGINWRLKRSGKTTGFVEAAPGDEKALARRLLRIGLKAEVIERFPWLLDALTPKMAILVGLALGAANAAQSLQPLGTTEAAAKNGQPRPRPVPAPPPASEPQTASA